MPTLSYYDDRKTHIEFLPELLVPADGRLRDRVATVTQQWADVVGTAATAHPTDWHMLQRVWSQDLVPTQ